MCERGKADLYKDGPRTTRRELLLPTKLPQPFIAYSEVVTNLVDYGPSHRDHDLFLGLALAADWILVDGDAIRKCTGVVPPFCERYPLVETHGNVNSNWPHRAHLIRPHLGVPGREHARVMSGGGAQ